MSRAAVPRASGPSGRDAFPSARSSDSISTSASTVGNCASNSSAVAQPCRSLSVHGLALAAPCIAAPGRPVTPQRPGKTAARRPSTTMTSASLNAACSVTRRAGSWGIVPKTMSVQSRARDARLEAWAERYAATPERPTSFTTLSGEPIQPLYTEADLPAPGSDRPPGRVSVHARRVPEHVPRAGCGRCASSPASARPRRPTSASATCSTTARPGCRTAFDMPTLMGHDSDHARSLGEVGREGVAIDTLDDMETLFAGIDLGEVTRVDDRSTRRRRSCSPSTSSRPRSTACRATGSAARSRPTSSRSTSPRRSGASRSTRRCGCSAT